MRVLFTYAGGSGHANPLVPIADAVANAGHAVAFAGHPSGAAVPEASGFTMFLDPTGARQTPGLIAPLLAVDMEREYRVVRDWYAGRLAAMRADRILEVGASWRPDIIVCDEMDFGSMVAAECLGLPHASVIVIAARSLARPELVAGPLDLLRATHGLPPDPALEMPYRDLVLSPVPPSFRDPADPLADTAHAIRPQTVGVTGDVGLEPWLACRADRPLVYVTLGTVFNLESGDLFTRLLAALRDLPVTAVVTVGREIDPAIFGPQPDTVRIERYVPQALLLPHCDVVVTHGGSGTVIGALTQGLPLVVLPMGADQMLNAERCERLGVGLTVDAVRTPPASIRGAIATVLGDPDYGVSAKRIRDEIAALPDAHSAVPLLESLSKPTDVRSATSLPQQASPSRRRARDGGSRQRP